MGPGCSHTNCREHLSSPFGMRSLGMRPLGINTLQKSSSLDAAAYFPLYREGKTGVFCKVACKGIPTGISDGITREIFGETIKGISLGIFERSTEFV